MTKKFLAHFMGVVVGAIFFFGMGFGGGMFWKDIQSTKQQLAKAEERLDTLVLNQIRMKAVEFASHNKLDANDLVLQAQALSLAQPCIICDVWERSGSSEYYSVPLVVNVNNRYGEGSFTIIPTTVFHVDGKEPTYEPAFVIYWYRTWRVGNSALRIGTDGVVYRKTGDGGWVPDPTAQDSIATIKDSARKSLIDSISHQS